MAMMAILGAAKYLTEANEGNQERLPAKGREKGFEQEETEGTEAE